MTTPRWIRRSAVLGLVAFCVSASATRMIAGQGPAASGKDVIADAMGFKEFSDRVQVFLTVQKAVEASFPALKSTDLPEAIAAYQATLARKLREARPNAKPGDLFTPAACEAFRHASHAVLDGPNGEASRAYMRQGAPSPAIRLTVNGTYPDTAPITALSPALLAAFPPLPEQLANRIVGRALIVTDVKSRLIIDIARLILP